MYTQTYDTTVNEGKRQCLSNATKSYCSQTIPQLVTVALVTSPGAGGDAFFENGKFRGYKDKEDREIDGIIYVYLREGMDIHDISQALRDSLKPNQYIQNLIISGHGNWNKMALSTKQNDSNKKITVDIENEDSKEFFETIASLMGEIKELGLSIHQTIILESCFTNSHVHKGMQSRMNFRDVLASHVDSNVSIYAANAPTYSGHEKYERLSDGTIAPIYKKERGVIDDIPNFSAYYTLKNGHFEYNKGTNSYENNSSTEWYSIFAVSRETANAFASLIGYDDSSIKRIEYYNAIVRKLAADRHTIRKLQDKLLNEKDKEGANKVRKMRTYYRHLYRWCGENIKNGNRPIPEVIEELRYRLYAVSSFLSLDSVEEVETRVNDEINKAQILF